MQRKRMRLRYIIDLLYNERDLSLDSSALNKIMSILIDYSLGYLIRKKLKYQTGLS